MLEQVLTAWASDAEVEAAGFVLAPEGRYVDAAHGIDWAVIRWRCPVCEAERSAPGPGEPPYCDAPGRPMAMVPVRLFYPAGSL